MSKLHITLLTAVAVLALATGGSALVAPQLIDYQGYLEDGNGNPITDTLSMTFTIYTDQSKTTSTWSETQSSVGVLGGLFNVTLGSVTPILDTVFNQDERWLVVTIGGNDLDPTRIVSTAYAHRVNTVDGATGGTINGNITAWKGNFGYNTNAGYYAFVAGVWNDASGDFSTVGGGRQDTASGLQSVVGGGWINHATGDQATVGGGQGNIASADWSTVAGGGYSTASGLYGAIGGGFGNLASATYSTVPGGRSNTAAAIYSMAAGRRAQANHDGSFVWADGTNAAFASDTANQFNVRASGGTRIFTNSSATVGVQLTAGSSAWTSISDSTMKRNKRLVEGKEILSRLMSLPIKQWSYKSQDPSIEHIGPMAQDFYAIFGLGEDDKTISTIDPAGVALAAIQEVYSITQKLEKKTARIDNLETQVAELQAQVTALLAERKVKSTDGKALSAVVGK